MTAIMVVGKKILFTNLSWEKSGVIVCTNPISSLGGALRTIINVLFIFMRNDYLHAGRSSNDPMLAKFKVSKER